MTPFFKWHDWSVKHRYQCIDGFVESKVQDILAKHVDVFAHVNFTYTYSHERFEIINHGGYEFVNCYVLSVPDDSISDDADRDESYNMFIKYGGYVFMINVNVDLRKHERVVDSILRLTKHARKKIKQWECDYEFN